ncbi:MAG: adenylosuccinate synthetase, partial [Candidatus Omnitrophica bacterium]|jgi:adenylosuccinate synthase|nr:adenylosuccinate synthetase [Candidatus Omnitrophota bacterium]
LNLAVFSDKLKDNLKEKNEIFRKVYGHPGFSYKNIYGQYMRYAKIFAPYICDTVTLLNAATDKHQDILLEGAQGTFLDIDFGTYPFVTSSSTTSGGSSIGSGIAPVKIDKVIGVVKAYTTRVGEGPFPTEFDSKFAEFLRAKGNEFGATTGRPRRCGWFDGLMLKESVMLNGISELCVMKMDVLDGLPSVKICVAYKYKGKQFKEFPHDAEVLANAKPVYIEMPGWAESANKPSSYKELPLKAREYLKRLEGLSGAKITMVSVGSRRKETIFV